MRQASAFGAGIYYHGTGTLTFGSGDQTVSSDIADTIGSGGTTREGGSVAIAKSGTGTLTLSTTNTYLDAQGGVGDRRGFEPDLMADDDRGENRRQHADRPERPWAADSPCGRPGRRKEARSLRHLRGRRIYRTVAMRNKAVD